MLTISAAPYRATVVDTDDGVEVRLYERTVGCYREVRYDVLDAPFHVVCDRVHDLVVGLRRSAKG